MLTGEASLVIRIAAIGAFALALLALTMIAIPETRHALARWFPLPGLRIEFVFDGNELSMSDPPDSIGSNLLLGKPVSIDEVMEDHSLAVALPTNTFTSDPDEVWFRDDDRGQVISFIYRATPNLPEIGTTGVSLLLMEIRAPDGPILYVKQALGDGSVSQTSVNGRDAFWIENGKLIALPEDPRAVDSQPAYQRRSGNVLIWSDANGVTFRLESMLDLESARGIAEGIEPLTRTNRTGNPIPSGVVWRVSQDDIGEDVNSPLAGEKETHQ